MRKEEFRKLTFEEMDLYHEALQKERERIKRDEDLRIGRGFAALINVVGPFIYQKKWKPKSALDIFPEYKLTEKPRPKQKSKKAKKSLGTVRLQAYIKNFVATENKKKLEAARKRIADNVR